jgi:hypothetical protein
MQIAGSVQTTRRQYFLKNIYGLLMVSGNPRTLVADHETMDPPWILRRNSSGTDIFVTDTGLDATQRKHLDSIDASVACEFFCIERTSSVFLGRVSLLALCPNSSMSHDTDVLLK